MRYALRTLSAGLLLCIGAGSAQGSDLVNVSAASYGVSAVAPESIVTAFGQGLAVTAQAAASLPMPTLLAGTRVEVTDSAGVERLAPLFFVSPSQINYLVPAGVAGGLARVTVTTASGHQFSGPLEVEALAPALFSAAANGQGVAAAVALRIRPDGSRSFEPVFRFDAVRRQVVAVPIDLGEEAGQVILSLFGTGFRGLGPHSAVAVRIAGAPVEVLSAGPQRDFAGLDQVNVELPRRLIGRGEVSVTLTVDAKSSNTVTIRIL